jgi:hypothetical protein
VYLGVSEKLAEFFTFFDTQTLNCAVQNSGVLLGQELDENAVVDRYVPLMPPLGTALRVKVDSSTRIYIDEFGAINEGSLSDI